jgi:hypothetical protein
MDNQPSQGNGFGGLIDLLIAFKFHLANEIKRHQVGVFAVLNTLASL